MTRGDVDLDFYAERDAVWKELGLAAPARRALVDAKLLKLADLKKFTLAELKALHGMGPNALAVISTAMKKSGIAFKK